MSTLPNPLAQGPAPVSVMSSIPDWGPLPAGAASSNPDAFAKGGMLDQAMLEVIQAMFTTQGPPTYTVPGQVFFYAKLRDLADGVTNHDAWWTCGKQEDVLPSQDGAYLMKNPASNKDLAIQESTNYALLIKSLADKSYPKQLLDCGNVHKIFTGLMIKTIRFQPEGRNNMKGTKPKTDASGNSRDPLGILVCESILKFPWEAAPRVAIASRPAAQPAAQPAYAPPMAQASPMMAAPPMGMAPAPAPPFAPNPGAPPMPMAAPGMGAPPVAVQPAVGLQAPAPAQAQATALPALTDQTQIATVLRDTMANLVAQAGPGGLPVAQIKVQVFRALAQTYDHTTVNTIAGYADNIQWLTSAGFLHDAAANTIKRP